MAQADREDARFNRYVIRLLRLEDVAAPAARQEHAQHEQLRQIGLPVKAESDKKSTVPTRITITREIQNEEVIIRDPDILGGTPVFRGTHVPFQALLDCFEGGERIDAFLNQFP